MDSDWCRGDTSATTPVSDLENAAVVPPPFSRCHSSAEIARSSADGAGAGGASPRDAANLKMGLLTIHGIGGVPGAPATRTSTR